MALDSKAAKQFQEPLDDLVEAYKTKHGLSRNAIAKKIGITASALSSYCKAEKEAGIDTLLKIAEYFDVDADYLLGRQKTKKTKNRSVFIATGLKDEAIAILDHFISDNLEIRNMPIQEKAIKAAKSKVLNGLIGDPSFADMMDMVVKMVFLKIISSIAPDTQAYTAIKNDNKYKDGSMVLTPKGSLEYYENTVITIFKREIKRVIDDAIAELQQEVINNGNGN